MADFSDNLFSTGNETISTYPILSKLISKVQTCNIDQIKITMFHAFYPNIQNLLQIRSIFTGHNANH